MRKLVSFVFFAVGLSLLAGCGAPVEGDPNPPTKKAEVPVVPGANEPNELTKAIEGEKTNEGAPAKPEDTTTKEPETPGTVSSPN